MITFRRDIKEEKGREQPHSKLTKWLPLLSVIGLAACVPSTPSPRIVALDMGKQQSEEVQEDVEQAEITFADVVKPKDVVKPPKDKQEGDENEMDGVEGDEAVQDNIAEPEEKDSTTFSDVPDSIDISVPDVPILVDVGEEESVGSDSGNDVKECEYLIEPNKFVIYKFTEGAGQVLDGIDTCTTIKLDSVTLDFIGAYKITISSDTEAVEVMADFHSQRTIFWNGVKYDIGGQIMSSPDNMMEQFLGVVVRRKL